MDTPVFLLNAESFDFNFCQYAGNGHYYWITDITSERNDLWSVACAVDVLATFKDEILATTAWVQYSSQLYDLNIVDKRLPTPLNQLSAFTSVTPNSFSENGFYVLCAAGVGYTGNTGGFTQMYGMSSGNLINLADRFYTLDEGLIDLHDFFMSPYQSIVDVFWVPFVQGQYGGGDDAIKLGNINMDVNGNIIVARNHKETVTLTITHPYGDFRDAEYCVYTLYLPFYGFIELSSKELYGMTTLTIDIVTDLYVGGIVYYVYANNVSGNQVLIGTYGASAKAAIPIGQGDSFKQSATSLSGLIAGNAHRIASFLGQYVGRLYEITNTNSNVPIYDDFYTSQPKASGSFSSVAMAKLPLYITLTLNYVNTSETPTAQNAVRGNACGKTLSLGSLSGFVQTAGASVSIDGELDHARRINAYLDGGVYLE